MPIRMQMQRNPVACVSAWQRLLGGGCAVQRGVYIAGNLDFQYVLLGSSRGSCCGRVEPERLARRLTPAEASPGFTDPYRGRLRAGSRHTDRGDLTEGAREGASEWVWLLLRPDTPGLVSRMLILLSTTSVVCRKEVACGILTVLAPKVQHSMGSAQYHVLDLQACQACRHRVGESPTATRILAIPSCHP